MPSVKNVSKIFLAFDLDTRGEDGLVESFMLGQNQVKELSDKQMDSKRIQKALKKKMLRLVRSSVKPKRVTKKVEIKPEIKVTTKTENE